MIRPAKEIEYRRLTTISFASKGYWNYLKEYFGIWENELTLSSEYIANNDVFVYERNGIIVGYYSISKFMEDIQISGIALY